MTHLRRKMADERALTQNARVRKLKEMLREAAYVHEHPEINPAGSRWSGAILTCAAVAKFVHDSQWPFELAIVFSEMAEGFKDLERRITPPIFSLNPEPLKRDRSSHRKFHHDWAAAILEMAIDGGEGEEKAATRIARQVNEWPALRNQEVTATTLINWRKTIRGRSSEDRKPFEEICKALRSEPDGGKAEIERTLAEGPRRMQKS